MRDGLAAAGDDRRQETARAEKAEAELARLREENDRLKSNLLALDTAAVKRYDTLLAVLRYYEDMSGDCGRHARAAISEVEGEK